MIDNREKPRLITKPRSISIKNAERKVTIHINCRTISKEIITIVPTFFMSHDMIYRADLINIVT